MSRPPLLPDCVPILDALDIGAAIRATSRHDLSTMPTMALRRVHFLTRRARFAADHLERRLKLELDRRGEPTA